MIHLLYSLDITSLDVHLFMSLQNSFNGKKSISWKTVKGTWNNSLLKMIKKIFLKDVIISFPEMRQKAIELNGEYVVQEGSW